MGTGIGGGGCILVAMVVIPTLVCGIIGGAFVVGGDG